MPSLASAQALPDAGLPLAQPNGAVLAIIAAIIIGLAVVAVVLAVALFAFGRKLRRRERTARSQADALRRDLDLAESLITTSGDALFEVHRAGDTGGEMSLAVLHSPHDQQAIPSTEAELRNFAGWLEAADVDQLTASVRSLSSGGQRFDIDLRTLTGTLVNAVGRPIGGRLIVRLRDLSRLNRDFADALALSATLQAETGQLKELLDTVDYPVWTADDAGFVSWSNRAFRARGAERPDSGLARAQDIVGEPHQWEAISAQHGTGATIASAAAAGDGDREETLIHLRAQVSNGQTLTAGYAKPAAQARRYEQALEMARTMQGQMLNALTTAVAVFNAERQLTFYNTAFLELFGFQRRMLDEQPHESIVLTYLKSTRQMPESGSHRGWRDPFVSAYTAKGPQTADWELHDGRFLRVVTAPAADGGAIWIMENETEKVDLQFRFNAATKVREATLEALREGVAVFGSNGRMQLINPSFQSMWGLSNEESANGAHIRDVSKPIRELARDRMIVDKIVGLVCALGGGRDTFFERLHLNDERVIDIVSSPLPAGATMLTANDVSASVQIEDTLRESNAALEEAARIKTAFIKHVSYELRSPLTSIIGFAQLLDDESVGGLNERQGEYLSYVLSSTQSLMALVDSILDLATVDAGILTLSLDRVKPEQLIDEALVGLRNRILDGHISVDTKLDPSVSALLVDEARMRQVLYNLLSNAVASTPEGGQVRVRTRLVENAVELSVVDHGRGMSSKLARAAFEPFETGQDGATGAGLGLTLARALVELHGGSVDLWSREGLGTVVRCRLPAEPRMMDPRMEKAAE